MRLSGILVLALLIRLSVVFLSGATWINTDSEEYLRMGGAIRDGTPYSYYPNGYPVLAAAAGVLAPQHIPLTLVLLNVLFSTVTVALVWRIADRTSGVRAAALAAFLAAVWPNQLNYVRQVMSEPLATLLLAGAVWAILDGRWLLGGAAAMGATVVRTVLGPCVPVFLVWVAWTRGRRKAAVMLVGVLLVWGLHAGLTRAGVIAEPSNVGGNILVAISGRSSSGVDYSTPRRFVEAEKAAPIRTYLAFALGRPAEFLSQRVDSLVELWGPFVSRGDPAHPRSNLRRAVIGLRFPLLIAALALLVMRPRWPDAWLLATPIFVVSAVHLAFFSTARFSFTAEPFAIVMASLTAIQLMHRVTGRQTASPQ